MDQVPSRDRTGLLIPQQLTFYSIFIVKSPAVNGISHTTKAELISRNGTTQMRSVVSGSVLRRR